MLNQCVRTCEVCSFCLLDNDQGGTTKSSAGPSCHELDVEPSFRWCFLNQQVKSANGTAHLEAVVRLHVMRQLAVVPSCIRLEHQQPDRTCVAVGFDAAKTQAVCTSVAGFFADQNTSIFQSSTGQRIIGGVTASPECSAWSRANMEPLLESADLYARYGGDDASADQNASGDDDDRIILLSIKVVWVLVFCGAIACMGVVLVKRKYARLDIPDVYMRQRVLKALMSGNKSDTPSRRDLEYALSVPAPCDSRGMRRLSDSFRAMLPRVSRSQLTINSPKSYGGQKLGIMKGVALGGKHASSNHTLLAITRNLPGIQSVISSSSEDDTDSYISEMPSELPAIHEESSDTASMHMWEVSADMMDIQSYASSNTENDSTI